MAQTSPNILIIMADQLAPHFTGAYGHPLVKTPHMDRLAERGMRFDAAYCHSPLCAPARFSMMAGQSVSKIGAYDNASEFLASIPTFAHYLTRMGYKTSLSGKMHFVGPDQLHGFQERVTTDVYPSDFAWTPDWMEPHSRIGKWYHNMESVQEAGIGAATFQIDYDDEVAFFAKRKIFDYARDKAEPFCMVASFIHPHDPYVALKKWWNLYSTDEIDLPKTRIAREDQDPFSGRLMDGIEATTTDVSDDEIRRARHAYYANTSYFDSKIGELMDTLDDAGFADNTVVIITSDHGDMLGERNLWYKMNFFEHSVRVPLIFAGPEVAQGIAKNACSHLDLLPTLLDIAASDGRAKPDLADPIDGRSLWPLASGGADDVDETIGEYCAEMTSHPVFMLRRGRYKYIHCDSDPALLFDLENDPDELVNLADDPAHAELSNSFADAVQERWDSEALRRQVIASQRRRFAVYDAMDKGPLVSWDYDPPREASQEYVRNHMDWTVAAERMRFPSLK